MAVLKQFSEKDRDYDRYMLRVEYLREQNTLKEDREIARAELEEAKKELDQAEKELSQMKLASIEKEKNISEAQLEIEKLKQQLHNN